MVAAGKIIPAEMIVRMLRKIIYSGDNRKRFILSSFPDIIEQAREFEKSCAQISAIIYTTTPDPIVEIKNNNLTLFNIDSLFQKEFRLKILNQNASDLLKEATLGVDVDYSIVVGFSLSGKTFLSNILVKQFGYKLIDPKAVEEAVKKTLGTDEEPFEGKVPQDKIDAYVLKIFRDDQAKGQRYKYLFDSITSPTADQFLEFS
jgi:adenylate kinase family enzyme